MLFIGMVIGAIILFLSFYIVGPYGAGIFLIVLFGLVFSTYQKNKEIYEDVKIIREKLGLLHEEEKFQQEIEMNQKEYDNNKDEPKFISKLDEEIEEELEKYMKDNKE
ncbi:hypothetical protein NYE70_02115 [Paenibacillus sp. FSL R5-0407]|uniref:hypothetical protein n=1 Tax=Paenibacillus sp. FSL R5-0407 TaxID=2975320 RepID=UPI0030F8CB5C